MENKHINGKVIYTPKGAALEYGKAGCNLYNGCYHGCEYCYLKRGVLSHVMGENEVTLKKGLDSEENAFNVFHKEMMKHIEFLREVGLFFSFSTDPLIKETRHLTLMCVKDAVANGVGAKLLTKNADFIDDHEFVSWFGECENKEMVHFGFTLTGRDDMEPRASSNAERIESMRKLHKMGFPTFASIEPVIDWKHARMVITLSLDCCDHYKVGLRSGVKKDYYDLVGSAIHIKELVEDILRAGRTVYLKNSTRKLLGEAYVPEEYNRILSMTHDMDGNPIALV